jgi:thiamine transporter ThiT
MFFDRYTFTGAFLGLVSLIAGVVFGSYYLKGPYRAFYGSLYGGAVGVLVACSIAIVVFIMNKKKMK